MIRTTLLCFALTLLTAPVFAQDIVAVVNAASFQPQFPVAPGGWATAFGDFASKGVSNVAADSLPFPTTLGGVQVFVNDVAAPMNFVGAGQINFLIPSNTPTGRQPFRVTVSGANTFTGTIQVYNVSPALISINPGEATKPGAVLNQDNTVNSEANPAQRGQTIQIYGVGADFAEFPADGAAAPTDRLIATTTAAKVAVSVSEVDASFSGLAPGLVNAWQINAVIPDAPYIKGLVPVSAILGNLRTNTVSIWVAQ